MANGYTACIDTTKLIDTKETLNSIESLFNSADLEKNFIELEIYLRNLNFEHGTFSDTYKYLINSALEKLTEVKEDITKLNTAIGRTIDCFYEYGSDGTRTISSLYEGTTSSLNINELLDKNLTINMTDNSKIFGENIDSTIEGFMIRNNITDFPQEFKSVEEWQRSLENGYKDFNLTEEELANQIDYDMSVWRQEQTASQVTNVVESNVASRQALINDYKNNYMEEFNLNKTDATNLANLKEELNMLRMNNGNQSEITNLENAIQETENSLGINYRKADFNENTLVTSLSNQENIPQQEPTITKIEPLELNNEEPSQPKETINTVPIGLGIAAAGISGAIGTVLVSEYNEKIDRENRIVKFTEDDEVQKNYTYEPASSNDTDIYTREKITESPEPYHASRNLDMDRSIFGNEPTDYREEE